MLNKAFSGGVSLSLILAACVATSGCVYDRNFGAEDGGGGEGGHETLGADGCGEGGHEEVGGGPAGEGGHEVGGGPATNPGAGGFSVGGGPSGEGGHEVGGGPSGEGGFGGGGIDTGSGGQGGFEECATCAQYITDGNAPTVCSGTSAQLYDALAWCTCEGACADACGDNVCVYADITQACQDCVLSSQGCATEYANCANDL